jgi:hypothetical protein
MAFISTAAFTDWFKTNFSTLPTAQVNAVLYTRAPQLDLDTSFAALEGFAGLADLAEWVPTKYAMTSSRNGVAEALFVESFTLDATWTALRIVDGSSVVAFNEDGLCWTFLEQTPAVQVQEQVMAVVFYLVGTYGGITDPVMFATTQGIGDRTVVHNEGRVGQTTESLGGVLTPGWLVAADTDTFTDFRVGSILLAPEEPDWESAHAQHMWLEPQRTNLLANPSFESGFEGLSVTIELSPPVSYVWELVPLP